MGGVEGLLLEVRLLQLESARPLHVLAEPQEDGDRVAGEMLRHPTGQFGEEVLRDRVSDWLKEGTLT